MTFPPPPPVMPPKKRNVAKGCAICAAAAFGLFVLSAVVAGIADGGKNGTATTEAKPPSRASSKPSANARQTTKLAATRPAATSTSTSGSSALPPAEARKKAAAVLRANDGYYQDEFNRGVTVILNRGNDGSFPAFHAWQQKAATDVQPGLDAFKQADDYFTADDEPASISDWQGDNGNLSADIAHLADDGLGVGGPDDATYRRKVQDDARKFPHDFQVAEADADKVAAGK